MHWLSSRFGTKVMRDLGLVMLDEPFSNLLTQGMVLNEIFFRKPTSPNADGITCSDVAPSKSEIVNITVTPGTGALALTGFAPAARITYFNPTDVEIKLDDKGNRIGAVLKSDGQPVECGGIGTMSKSKNNGVDPQELIEEYGADTARFFMMFAAPPEQTLEWSDSGVEGAARFLRRLWNYGVRFKDGGGPAVAPALRRSTRFEIHSVLKQANYDIARHQFNTVASAAMKILNALDRLAGVDNEVAKEGLEILLRLLSPITPHICHHLWRELGFGENILTAKWPEHRNEALIVDEIELVVQVNGKKRGDVRVPHDADQAAIEKLVLADPSVQKFVAGLPIKKVVVVPGRLVNVVV